MPQHYSSSSAGVEPMGTNEVRLIMAELGIATQADLARLLHKSLRQIQRWLSPSDAQPIPQGEADLMRAWRERPEMVPWERLQE
jgi:hypothetical protein